MTITPAEEETAVPEMIITLIVFISEMIPISPALIRRRIWMLLSRRQKKQAILSSL